MRWLALIVGSGGGRRKKVGEVSCGGGEVWAKWSVEMAKLAQNGINWVSLLLL